MNIGSMLEKGIFLEDKGILLVWGKSLSDLANTMKFKTEKCNTGLEIGNHVVLGGLQMTEMVVGNSDYKEEPFNVVRGWVKSSALDYLADKFDISLQPSSPKSTSEYGVEMVWVGDGIEISYGVVNIRGEGSYQSCLEIKSLKFGK